MWIDPRKSDISLRVWSDMFLRSSRPGYVCDMSTTVDEDLLANARRAVGGQPDAVLIDEALCSFLLRHRAGDWTRNATRMTCTRSMSPTSGGDLASFRQAAVAS